MIDGSAVEVPLQARRLVALVALHDGWLHRSVAAGTLWAEATSVGAGAKLRNALWRARSTFADLITSQSDHLRLGASVEVDVDQVERWAGRDGPPVAGPIPDRDVVRLLGRDLLPTWDEDWLLMERERVRQVRLHALERLSRLHRERGCFSLAVSAALAAVIVEPLRESAQRELIESHLAEGNRSEAIRQYRSYQNLLRVELGAEPSDRLQRVIAEPSLHG